MVCPEKRCRVRLLTTLLAGLYLVTQPIINFVLFDVSDVSQETSPNIETPVTIPQVRDQIAPARNVSQISESSLAKVSTRVTSSSNETTSRSPVLDMKKLSIYKLGWDLAPIVVEEYKLVFFSQPKVSHREHL